MSKNSKDHGIDRYHDLDPQADQTQQLLKVYADWASDYDHDNDHALETVSQPNTVAMLTRHCEARELAVLDYGCGTGLVGLHLQKAGFPIFDGADISPEMLEIAKKRGYGRLFLLGGDESLPSESYDVVLCVGVFTHGHLGTEGMNELLRLTRRGGLICFTVNEGVWQTGGFQDAIATLQVEDQWVVLEQRLDHYMRKEGVHGWYVTARKT